MFIGYPYGKKGWKVYDLETGDLFVSRDVIFDEQHFPFVENKKEKLPNDLPVIWESDGLLNENWRHVPHPQPARGQLRAIENMSPSVSGPNSEPQNSISSLPLGISSTGPKTQPNPPDRGSQQPSPALEAQPSSKSGPHSHKGWPNSP